MHQEGVMPLMLCAITRQDCVTSHPKTHAAGHQIQRRPHHTYRHTWLFESRRWTVKCDESVYNELLSSLFSSATDLQVWLWSLFVPTKCSESDQRGLVHGPTRWKVRVLTYEFHLKSSRFFQLCVWRLDLKNHPLISAVQPHFRQHPSTSSTML